MAEIGSIAQAQEAEFTIEEQLSCAQGTSA